VLNSEEIVDETKALGMITGLCEQNGKPCCLNLITAADNAFLKKLDKAESDAKKAKAALEAEQNSVEAPIEGSVEGDEQQKQEEIAQESVEEDEVGDLIAREEEEHNRNQKESIENERNAVAEAAAKKIRDEKESKRLEEIR
jgi:hypothetical protein